MRARRFGGELDRAPPGPHLVSSGAMRTGRCAVGMAAGVWPITRPVLVLVREESRFLRLKHVSPKRIILGSVRTRIFSGLGRCFGSAIIGVSSKHRHSSTFRDKPA